MDGDSQTVAPPRRAGLAWLIRAKILLVNGLAAAGGMVLFLSDGFRWWMLGWALAVGMSGLLVWMCTRMLLGSSELEDVVPNRIREVIGFGHLAAAAAFLLSVVANQELVGSVVGGSWSVLMSLFVFNMPALFGARPAA
jgi:hypothetical protein